MAIKIISNIGLLVNVRDEWSLLRGKDLAVLPCISDAYLMIDNDEIVEYGSMKNLGSSMASKETFDAKGAYVLPAWCDSHTHLVFAASREEEFVDKLKGVSYAEIAAKGGGILNSAKKLNSTSEDELFNLAWKRLEMVSKLGTGTIEIKSGYGLTIEGELKMLRVIKRLKEKSRLHIRATFLGAHAFPEKYKDNQEAYIKEIIEEMIPTVAGEKLADYIDVFCEKGFFTTDQTERICKAGKGYGLKPKIHANQLSLSGGVESGVKLRALSVDHLETMDEKSINALAGSYTIGTCLPTAAMFLRMQQPPAREMIDAGCALAIATDFNPGSSPSGNMNLVVSLACIQMKMLPEEAVNAATLNGAYAMELADKFGSISAGKKASLVLTKKIPSLAYLPYAFGENLIDKVMIRGEWIS